MKRAGKPKWRIVVVGVAVAAAAAVASVEPAARAEPTVVVASKSFTESVVLGEIVAQVIAARSDASVRHARQLGGTRVLWSALLRGDVDVYPEYTGTIIREILAAKADATALEAPGALDRALGAEGVRLGPALGFANGYALGMVEDRAARLGIRRFSDLVQHPTLIFGFSNEFLDRGDGWRSLRDAYRLPQRDVRGLDHDLAYRGLQAGDIGVIDLYSTDAEIAYYHLRVLDDDRRHFPAYRAVLLYRADLEARAPAVVTALSALAGRIDEATMIALNSRAKIARAPESVVAADFVRRLLGGGTPPSARADDRLAARLWSRTREHLALVAISLLGALLVGLPLGVLAARHRFFGQVILSAVGVVQTIPSLALLVLMIPLLGIGGPPAIAALFLYSLLPIVRGTASGLAGVAPELRDSARALGLSEPACLRLVELPLASPAILSGIKTSAVINVGTATLGALIGAGGYGQAILTGVRLDSLPLILEGALPSAALALVVQGIFDLGERWLVPRGLRLR